MSLLLLTFYISLEFKYGAEINSPIVVSLDRWLWIKPARHIVMTVCQLLCLCFSCRGICDLEKGLGLTYLLLLLASVLV